MAFDQTTKTFDLVRALAETSIRGNGVAMAVTELGRWLSRERIPDEEFQHFLSQTAGLAYPNENGLQLRKKIDNSSHRLKLGGLDLLRSGSIGRMLAYDSRYCYVVTTAATLMSYHDQLFATEVLCDMAVGNFDKNKDRGSGTNYPHLIRRSRLWPVAKKVVDSIAQNVVNCGYDLRTDLPSEFKHACLHCLQHRDLAACLMTIQRSTTELLIISEYFVADLFIWLRCHWDGERAWNDSSPDSDIIYLATMFYVTNIVSLGTIVVTMAGKIAYETISPDTSTKVTLMVKKLCSTSGLAHAYNVGDKVQIHSMVDGLQKPLLHVEAKPIRPMSSLRLPLYCAESINHGSFSPIMLGWEHGLLNTSQLDNICLITQEIVRWLLNLELRPQTNHRGSMAFRPIFTNAKSTYPTLEHLLSRWPGITNIPFGTPPDNFVVFKKPPEVMINRDSSDWVKCFPPLATLLDKIAHDCRCESCKERKPVGQGKSGCLRETAFTAFSILIGHTIADGFGAKDTSGMVDVKWLSEAVQGLLCELVFDERVSWDVWLKVATGVALGCPWKSLPLEEDSTGASLIAATQFGSMVATASWVDLNRQQSRKGCFGFDVAEGRFAAIDNIADEFAVLKTEATMALADEVLNQASRSFPHVVEQFVFNRTTATDDTHARSSVAVIPQPNPFYRLLTLVRTESFYRIVDPAQTLWSLLKAHYFDCTHPIHETDIEDIPSDMNIWSFDDVLGGWDEQFRPEVPESGDVDDAQYGVEMAVCNTPLKLNVAMALSYNGLLVLDSRKSCLLAAYDYINGDKWEEASFPSKRILDMRLDEGALSRVD